MLTSLFGFGSPHRSKLRIQRAVAVSAALAAALAPPTDRGHEIAARSTFSTAVDLSNMP